MMLRLLPILLLTTMLSGCGESPSANVPTSNAGPLAADFTFADLEGENRSLKQWQGKVILLNFWAPWCPPCREEVPAFIELQEKYKKKGFIIVGITLDNLQNAEVFADTMGINYPILIADMGGTELAKKYGNKIGGLPYTAVINRQGRVVSTHRSAMTHEDAEKAVVDLL